MKLINNRGLSCKMYYEFLLEMKFIYKHLTKSVLKYDFVGGS